MGRTLEGEGTAEEERKWQAYGAFVREKMGIGMSQEEITTAMERVFALTSAGARYIAHGLIHFIEQEKNGKKK